GRARRHRVVARALHGVGTVDAGRGDLDEHFAGLGLGNGARADLQHLGAAGLSDLDGAHGVWDCHFGLCQGCHPEDEVRGISSGSMPEEIPCSARDDSDSTACVPLEWLAMPLPPPASPGIPLEEIDTPALVVDLDAPEGNIARMAEAVNGGPVRLRPHAKSHKCAEIARRQIAAGAVGGRAQKASAAEGLVAGGVADVLVSNEIVGAQKVSRLARLARASKVAVLVDDAGNVAELQSA